MLNSLSLKKRSTKISILVMSVLVAFPLLPYEFTGKGNIAPDRHCQCRCKYIHS